MNIDINGVSITLTDEQLKHISAELDKSKYPQKGTICWVWNNDITDKALSISKGNGSFSRTQNATSFKWNHYEVIPMGISFSDEVLTKTTIKPEHHKQLVLVKDGHREARYIIGVIDANNKCTFFRTGEPSGPEYDEYRLCTTPIGNLPQMYRDIVDACR